MCGIFGIIRSDRNVSLDELKTHTRLMEHRGPDGEGYAVHGTIGLGHRRLSIIDLAQGAQPMQNSSGTHSITYNGELYNYKDLKEELVSLGYKFSTHSDTEVVLQAYVAWGAEALCKFRGMFAFAIVDTVKEKIFLARDYSGIKPLVYRSEKSYFAFASEIKALSTIDTQAQGEKVAVSDFLQYGFVPAPYTIYKNIFKLKAGHYKEIDFDGSLGPDVAYWSPQFSEKKTNKSQQAYQQELDEVLSDTVKAHMVSDVPVGVLLSGGIDSTLVAVKMKALTSNIEAFTIGFEEDSYNEIEYAQKVADQLGIRLNYKILTRDIYKDLPKILALYDEPFGDDSAVPTWHVSRLAREQYSLVLSGDGADELFAGYWRYKNALATAKPKTIWSNIALSFSKNSNKHYNLKNFNTRLTLKERTDILKTPVATHTSIFDSILKKIKKYPLLEKVQFIDFKLYLPYNICTKVDIASMANSLEVRPVFLDRRVFKLAFTTPIHYKFSKEKKKGGKSNLKALLNTYFDEDFVYRKKQGFSSPIKELFLEHNLYYNLLIEGLKSPAVEEVLDSTAVRRMLDLHQEGTNKAYALFTILSFVIWQNHNPSVRFVA